MEKRKMKKVILLTAMLTSCGALANISSTCKSVHEYAGIVMEARQLEMPITKLVELANGDKVAEVLIMNAYKQPAFRAKDNQEKEIGRFANQAYLVCLEAKGKKK